MSSTNVETARAVIRKARGALARYRFMAIFTGVMLLALCLEMVLHYIVQAEGIDQYIRWIPFAHGWIYVVYLITVLDLWNKMRWSWGRLVAMALAGVVPVMSFIVEARLHREADAQLTLLERQYASAGSGGDARAGAGAGGSGEGSRDAANAAEPAEG